MFIPAIEKESREEIERYQLQRLKELLHYLQLNSAYYRQLFKVHGIQAGGVSALKDLENFPLTQKDTFHARSAEFLCVPKNKIAEYTSTSGTTGQPVTVALTENDLERLAYNEYISFCCAGGTRTDVYQLMLTLDKQFMAGMAYYSGIRKLGAGVVRIGPGTMQMQLDAIRNLETTVLVGVPGFILKLAEFAQAQGIDLNSLSVQKAVCIGESTRNADLSPNIMAQQINAKWNIELYSTYASTEMQTAFTECSEGCGGHHHPELVIIEIVDEEGKQLPAGEPGEVVITTLGIEGMPLLRYQTGDICCYYDQPCACGRNTLRLGPVIGRKNQLIKFKGTTLYPPSVFNVLNEIRTIEDYILEVSSNEYGTDELKLHIITQQSLEIISSEITQVFQSRLRVVPQIMPATAEQFVAMRKPEVNRKTIKFIDSRKG